MYFSTSGNLSETANRLTAEVFIPRKRATSAPSCFTKIGQTFKKIFPILFVSKYLYSINAPAHNA